MRGQRHVGPHRRVRPGMRAIAGRALGLALLLGVAPPLSATPSRGAAQFEICQSCHGLCAEGNEALGAPRLAGLGEAYLARQLAAFRGGWRGANDADLRGTQMRAMAQVLAGEEAISAVTHFAAALPSRRPAPVVTGDVERGRSMYATCAACHGAEGQGEATAGAPRLSGLSDSYQLRQLEAFRAGWRGADARDAVGATMRAMALTLPDEAALHDVIAYVATLAPPAAGLPPPDAPAACGR